MHELTMNDFFCGCGGMAVGFKNAGYRVVGAWDFDKYAVQSYRENLGDYVKNSDIREMTWADIPQAKRGDARILSKRTMHPLHQDDRLRTAENKLRRLHPLHTAEAG